MGAELVGALCTILTFTCAAQILITAVLAFRFSHFLTLSHCNLATTAGVISGLVAAPMVIQLKTAQISPHVEHKYGYTIWYQRMAISVCVVLHAASGVIALSAILTPRTWDEDFFNHMRRYNTKQTSKSLVDNIQWALQCCGARSYEDWFTLDWDKKIKRSYSKRDAGNAVPFSCCARKVLVSCGHHDVLQQGATTINKSGCGPAVRKTAHLILWTEFCAYMACIMIELMVIYAMQRNVNRCAQTEHTDSMLHKYFKLAKSKTWSKFANEFPTERRRVVIDDDRKLQEKQPPH